jgi:hypothetical protein
MNQPQVLGTMKLRIANQARVVNQIAGTYKDVYRALMEYVDNAADAAAVDDQKPRHLRISVNTTQHEVVFEDDCSGMSPKQLGDLLGSIGTSKKTHLPWVNGEFGFGVHAFRAFSRYIEFTSRTKGEATCTITIDREADENTEVPITRVGASEISTPTGTRIRIYGFRRGVFKGDRFTSRLQREVEEHFDDVIQNGILEILIKDDRVGTFSACRSIDLGSLPGTPIKLKLPVESPQGTRMLDVDVKLVEGAPLHHPVVLTRNGRRILPVGEIQSFRRFLRGSNRDVDVWDHPQLTGRIEIDDIASPNITRDDLQQGEERDILFEALGQVQTELQRAVDASMTKHRDRQLESASKVLSERLAHVMRRLSTMFRRPVAGTAAPGNTGEANTGIAPGGPMPGGGGPGDVPGAGGSNDTGSGGTDLGKGGLGPGSRGAHEGGGPEGKPGGTTVSSGGPELLFSHLDPAIRCQVVGYQITVNLDHPAYRARIRNDTLDERLLGHIARIISPCLTEKLYETQGQIPTPIEFGERAVDLAIMLEDDFMAHEEDIAFSIRTPEPGEQAEQTAVQGGRGRLW